MSAPDIDQTLIDNFRKLAGETRLTILLGAGASTPSGLPSWEEFTLRLVVDTGLVETEGDAEKLIANQDQTIILEATQALAGDDWNGNLYRALYGDEVREWDLEPSPLHLAAAGHYLDRPDRTSLATLNFDTLLESAVLSNGESIVVVDAEDGERIEGAAVVHHLHGAIFNDSAEGAIVTYRDYANLVAKSDPWQFRYLSEALGKGPLLLAGTSFRDPDIRHWLHLITTSEKPPNSALVTIVRQGLGFDRKTFEGLKHALEMEWKAIGITALPMHDFSDIATVIRELSHVDNVDYRSPKDRAGEVWTSHIAQTESRQAEYAQYLLEDAKIVARDLNAQTFRATLWLADGEGKLARYASENVHYAASSELKRVPSGHDSPWIAGEAIATEEVTLKDQERDSRVTPSWESVLAIPIFVGDGVLPDFASAVVTFGVSKGAESLASEVGQKQWQALGETLSEEWGARLNVTAFSSRGARLDNKLEEHDDK